jgi:hypothetical protein
MTKRIIEDWNEIETKKQKKGLIDAVLSEMVLLRKSLTFRDLLSDEGVILAEIDRTSYVENGGFYTLRMLRTGKIVEDHSYMKSDGYFSESTYDRGIPILKPKLPKKIDFYKITPKDIYEIRKRIER